ncbi:Putative F-box protein At1g67623 [Linum perenne]
MYSATKQPLKSRANRRRRSTASATATRRNIITNLPSELVVEILSHVASNSVNDLFNARATCKLMSESGSERHVLRKASVLDKFCRRGCIKQRKVDYSRFMAECVGSDNPEALLCLGIEEYFYGGRDEGVRYLRYAAEKGMKAAKYACGMFSLLDGGDVEKEEGLMFLEGVRKADDVRECRSMVKLVLDSNMWVNGDRGARLEKNMNEVVVRRCGCIGRLKCFAKNPDFEWLSSEEQVAEVVDSRLCDSCFWEFEASVFVQVCEG